MPRRRVKWTSMKQVERAAGVEEDVSERTVIFTKTKMCKFHILGMCTKGDKCRFAHEKEELNPLPDLTCTKLCKTLITTGVCQDPDCRYAHNKDQLRFMPEGPPSADVQPHTTSEGAIQPPGPGPQLQQQPQQPQPQPKQLPKQQPQQQQQQPRRLKNQRAPQDRQRPQPQQPAQEQQLEQQVVYYAQQLQQHQQHLPQDHQPQQQAQMMWPCVAAMPMSSQQLAQAAMMQQVMAGFAAQAATVKWAAVQQVPDAATAAGAGLQAQGCAGAIGAPQQPGPGAADQEYWLHDAHHCKAMEGGELAASAGYPGQGHGPGRLEEWVQAHAAAASPPDVGGGHGGRVVVKNTFVSVEESPSSSQHAACPRVCTWAGGLNTLSADAGDSPVHDAPDADGGGAACSTDPVPAGAVLASPPRGREGQLLISDAHPGSQQTLLQGNLIVKNTFLEQSNTEESLRPLGLRSVATASGALDAMG